MPLTFADLIRLRTRDERRDALLAELSARGFPVTSWAAGGVARTLVEGVAQGDADLWLAVSAIARGGLLQYAEGDWLTELARSHYEVERIEATFARHTVRLSFTAGGPGTIAPGQLVAANPSGLTFRSINTGTETIPASGSGYLDLVVQCERAGLAGNSAPTVLVTPARRVVLPAVQQRQFAPELLQDYFGRLALVAVLVGVLARLQLALEIDFRAIAAVLLRNAAQRLIEYRDVDPFGLVLALAGRLVAPAFSHGH